MNIAYRHVVLIGMMGSGKTTCGRSLAKRLGWGFWDYDEALMEATGSTAGELQRMRGQARSARDRASPAPQCADDANRHGVRRGRQRRAQAQLLQGELTVWLRASAVERENIAHSGQHHRPLPEDPIAVLQRMSDARLPAYKRLADITVDVAIPVTCDLMEALAASLERRRRISHPIRMM